MIFNNTIAIIQKFKNPMITKTAPFYHSKYHLSLNKKYLKLETQQIVTATNALSVSRLKIWAHQQLLRDFCFLVLLDYLSVHKRRVIFIPSKQEILVTQRGFLKYTHLLVLLTWLYFFSEDMKLWTMSKFNKFLLVHMCLVFALVSEPLNSSSDDRTQSVKLVSKTKRPLLLSLCCLSHRSASAKWLS